MTTSTDNIVQFFADNFTAFEVNSILDTDDGACAPIGTGNGCTLREAINAANADAGAETITFDPTVFASQKTISLPAALAAINSDVTIQGPGANLLTVKNTAAASATSRVFLINSGVTVTISGLTISGGNVTTGNLGGGIYNTGAVLNVNNSTISGNSAGFGGGIYTVGALNINNSTISGNTASTGLGGGIYVSAGATTIINSTISGNNSTSSGGGIFLNSASVLLSNSTVTNNTANAGQGGGILALSGLTARSSIIAGNINLGAGAKDFFGTATSQGFNLIGTVIASSGFTNNVNNDQVGTSATPLDPKLDPLGLQNNGGPTLTIATLCTSSAIDKGKSFGSVTDQRGGVRPFDLADSVYPNAAGGDGSDIGAYESQSAGGCLPTAIPPATAPSTNEDVPVTITLTGTFSQNTPLTFIISQQPAHSLAPLTPGSPNCVFNLSMTCTATVSYTPALNYNGPDLFKFKTSAGAGLDSEEADVNITVNPVNDPPSFLKGTNQTVSEDAGPQTVNPWATSISQGPNETGQTLTFNVSIASTIGNIAFSNGPAIDPLTGTLTYTPVANSNGSATINVTLSDNGSNTPPNVNTSAVQTFTITVLAVADTPSVTNATTNEDVQTTNGLIVSRSAVDGNEVTHFQITGITNGSLFQNNGTTPIANGDFITFAQANAGLKFTPAADFFGTGSFDVQSSLSNANGSLGGGVVTATITVNPVADIPTVTNTTTNEDTQTTNGLVVSRNPVDGPEVTHFKITNILNGSLFQNNGTTPIVNGDFITFAQGNAGLKFTPSPNFFGSGSFDVQSSLSNANGGLGGGVVTATITVNPVADTPSVTNAATNEDTQTTSGLVITRNPVDGAEVTHFQITGITNGSLFQNNGTTPIANGDFITFAQANAGLKFTPAANFFGTGSFDVQSSLSNANGSLGGGVVTATITVNPVADIPTVTNTTTNEDTQTTNGLVVSRNPVDGPEVTHFKITNILNGTLFQNNGTTPIVNGDFITFAQGNAGLKFTPSPNFFGSGSFDVQSSLSNANGGLGGGVVTATITVNPVADTRRP